ncbi:unnamed protein product [Nippostrongylus brasiliensis]|uniref:SLC38A9 n=1 Tax=Nippostrongylus brasiliensis TaxID=27835 RepID=A0A0N4XSB3_NIPBR|nr:unnamed protein product [Nippostrongylus brasiliensis]
MAADDGQDPGGGSISSSLSAETQVVMIRNEKNEMTRSFPDE